MSSDIRHQASDLPAPPIGAEVDLKEWPYMPLYGERLFDSDTWAYASDEGRVAALQLWWKAWRQVPAGSLPDDDVILAKLAGYGRAVKAWRRIRDQALRGFEKCADGRLYHFVLADIAREKFEESRAKRDRREQDRERKRALRSGPAGRGTRSASPSGSVGRPQDVRRNSGGQDADKGEVSAGSPARKERKRKGTSTDAGARACERRNSGGRGADVSAGSDTDTAADIVRLFDEVRDDVFGEAERRPWPHAADHVTAGRWLAAGASAEMLRAVFREVMERQGRTCPDDPPASLKFCDKAVARALERDRTGRAAGARAMARAWLDGDWRAEWGPEPGKAGSPVPDSVLSEIRQETAKHDTADTDEEAGDDRGSADLGLSG